MKSICLIKKNKESDWVSCKSIVENIHKAYSEYPINLYEISDNEDLFLNKKVALSIFKKDPDEIIWIDHYPTPTNLVKELYLLYQNTENKVPNLRFHIYGDFILNAQSWTRCEKELRLFPCQFICASHKQEELINKLFSEKEINSTTIPFPLNTNQFNQSPDGTDQIRQKHKIENEDVLFLYTGRLSYQKNITALIEAFSKAKKMNLSNIKLLIAGPMDDLGMPYIGKSGPLGAFYGFWKDALIKYRDLFDSNIIQYIGEVDHKKLKDLYQASDYYINISTHNDEDYGMAPAESLLCGCKNILTNWGGFFSFKKYFPDNVKLVSIDHNETRYIPKAQDILRLIISSTKVSAKEKELISKQAKAKLSVDNIGKLYGKNLSVEPKQFKGFNKKFYELVSNFISRPSAPFRSVDKKLNKLYYDLYEEYGNHRAE